MVGRLPVPDPPLRSSTVGLRAWKTADLSAVVAAWQDPSIARFSAAVPAPFTLSDARDWLSSQGAARQAGSRLELAIVPAESRVPCGAITLSSVERKHARAMLSYWLTPEGRGRGLATEAVRLLAGWAFDVLGLVRLEMFIEPDNFASQRVAERCGFTREGLLRSRWVSKGQRRDSIVYGLLAHEEANVSVPPATW